MVVRRDKLHIGLTRRGVNDCVGEGEFVFDSQFRGIERQRGGQWDYPALFRQGDDPAPVCYRAPYRPIYKAQTGLR